MTVGPVGDTSADRGRDLVDVLRDLAELRDSGLLTEDEFQRARSRTVAPSEGAEQRARPAR